MNHEQPKNKRRGFDPDKLGIWEGCNGEFFPGAMPCRICGRSRAHHLPAYVPAAKPQRNHQTALEPIATFKGSLLTPHEACRVVITRGYGPAGPLDLDNLVGGLKQLRDQITEQILRRSSDAEKDGILWEYRQEPGRGVKIEIFRQEKITEGVNS